MGGWEDGLRACVLISSYHMRWFTNRHELKSTRTTCYTLNCHQFHPLIINLVPRSLPNRCVCVRARSHSNLHSCSSATSHHPTSHPLTPHHHHPPIHPLSPSFYTFRSSRASSAAAAAARARSRRRSRRLSGRTGTTRRLSRTGQAGSTTTTLPSCRPTGSRARRRSRCAAFVAV